MNQFSVEEFAAGCKEVMSRATHRREAARAYLQAAIQQYGADDIIRALQEKVPPGSTIGEMIVHVSPTLTLLYARLPPRIQSGIHNHTVCACIGQLRGNEVNRLYERSADGRLRETSQMTVRAGEAIALHADVIHSIENPGDEEAHALHIYSGDFGALMDRRSLWGWDDHQEKPFSFPELLRESVSAMHHSGNRAGLSALAVAIPVTKPLIDALPDA
jgi:predicted metal-dependent enzyme (double-stranded beta helix superfamily)